jgi:hypothetical protein
MRCSNGSAFDAREERYVACVADDHTTEVCAHYFYVY